MNQFSKTRPPQDGANGRASGEKPEAAGLLPLLKDLNLLQATAEKKGYEFLSYLLDMAILEAQSLASGGAAETGGFTHDPEPPLSEDG